MRKLNVDMSELLDALSGSFEEGFQHFLHLRTGEVVLVVPPDYRVEFDNTADLVDDAPDDYAEIPRIESHVQYRWMEEFARDVEEPDLREKLTTALDGKGAFRRFRGALRN